MKKFVRMLGLALLGLFFYFTVWIPIDCFAPGVGDAISELGFIISAYYLYKAGCRFHPLAGWRISKARPTPPSSRANEMKTKARRGARDAPHQGVRLDHRQTEGPLRRPDSDHAVGALGRSGVQKGEIPVSDW